MRFRSRGERWVFYSTGWGTCIVVYCFTLAFFAAIGKLDWPWETPVNIGVSFLGGAGNGWWRVCRARRR